MSDEEYMKLLDVAFQKAPKLAVDVSDFKVPKIDLIVQGNKSMIRNLSTIADRARRSPEEVSRYMSKELAVPVNIEEGRLIISGKFREDELNKRIERYFEVYVICKECHKPDSHLETAGRGMFYFVCEACGARYGIKSY